MAAGAATAQGVQAGSRDKGLALGKSVSSRFSERLDLKKLNCRVIEEDTKHQCLTSTYMHTHYFFFQWKTPIYIFPLQMCVSYSVGFICHLDGKFCRL